MKRVKKIASLMVAMLLAFAMVVPVAAAPASGDPSNEFSITINNTSETLSMEGNTYSAYKLFDVTYEESNTSTDNSYAYQIAEAFKEFSYVVGEGETQKTYKDKELIKYLSELKNDSEALNAFSKAAGKYINENNIQATASAKASGAKTVTIQVTDPGYYLVAASGTAETNQTVEALCALTTTDPAASVNLKADAPSIEKKIDAATDTDPNNGNELVGANNASVGDKVPFVITSKVPVMKGYNKYFFVVTDTLSEGLTFNNDIKITIGEEELNSSSAYAVTMYKSVTKDGKLSEVTENANEARAFEVVFKNFIQYKDNPDTETVEGKEKQEIKITYTATLNDKAKLGTEGNENSVKLTYSTNPNTNSNGDPENPDKPGPNDPKGDTPEKKTYTYVTGIQLTKVDNSNIDPAQASKLQGAKFTITGTRNNFYIVNEEIYKEDRNGDSYLLKDGTYTMDAPTADTLHLYDAETVEGAKKYTKIQSVTKETKGEEDFSAEGYVNKNGVLTFKGLSEGDYTIKEVVAPDGYNILDTEIKISIDWTEPTENETTCSWTVQKIMKDPTTGKDVTETLDVDNNTSLFDFYVVNNRGSLLPSTGGIGTTIFYVVGGLLVAGAGILLVTKKRMSAR